MPLNLNKKITSSYQRTSLNYLMEAQALSGYELNQGRGGLGGIHRSGTKPFGIEGHKRESQRLKGSGELGEHLRRKRAG